jgi:hypothetical protein
MLNQERLRGTKGWWYLSFVDVERGGFLGACIVEAFGVATALEEANRLGINPGGEVASVQIPPAGAAICAQYRDRLLSKAELEAMDAGLERNVAMLAAENRK